jgi:hypothetical protein
MEFLKKLWAWLLSQTTIDEQIEAKVAKVTKEVSEVKAAIEKVVDEASDVVEEVKPKKRGRKTKA